jgi:hypothetical protein
LAWPERLAQAVHFSHEPPHGVKKGRLPFPVGGWPGAFENRVVRKRLLSLAGMLSTRRRRSEGSTLGTESPPEKR